MQKTDPFTRTPGIAGRAYINTHCSEKIISELEPKESSKFVYKITGLRGSGKSVEYAEIIGHFKKSKGWLVYTLSAAGIPLTTLISLMSKEKFYDDKAYSITTSSEANVSGNAVLAAGSVTTGISKTTSDNSVYYDEEATLEIMINQARKEGYRILIGIDDISRTKEMVRFLSIINKLINECKNVYLVCTGLSKNIEDFSKEASLTFFKRSDSCEITSLKEYDIAAKYRELLNVSFETSKSMAKMTKGYAYAYQVLGMLYFSKKEEQTIDDIRDEFDRILFADSYELIWADLTAAEKEFVRCVLKEPSGSSANIREALTTPDSFPVLRNRLIKKHILNTTIRGKITIDLPDFDLYVEEWAS